MYHRWNCCFLSMGDLHIGQREVAAFKKQRLASRFRERISKTVAEIAPIAWRVRKSRGSRYSGPWRPPQRKILASFYHGDPDASFQSSNGSFMSIVSSRSGLVDRSATGQAM